MLVERSPKDPNYARIFKDEEFEQAGATLIEEGAYKNAPKDNRIIIGLKELEEKEEYIWEYIWKLTDHRN